VNPEYISRSQVLLQYLLALDATVDDDEAFQRASQDPQVEGQGGDLECLR
jgi:hypothetical protein